GSVWWGWWMRQYETPPEEVFGALAHRVRGGEEPPIYLFDTGRTSLYSSRIIDIRAALAGDTIGPPDLAATPEYYHRGSYPAWVKLGPIGDAAFGEVQWTFAALP